MRNARDLFRVGNTVAADLAAVCAGHVLGHGRLSDRKAELEHLATNTRRIPKPILHAHASDQHPETHIDPRPASQVAGFPTPIAAETRAMPLSAVRQPPDLRTAIRGTGHQSSNNPE